MRRLSLLLFAIAGLSRAQNTVGGNAPSLAIQQSFVNAYARGTFSTLITGAPTTQVISFGSPGLVQTFTSASNASQKAALVDPDPYNVNATYQIYPDLYTFYLGSVGGNPIAGYPTMDTTACPTNTFGACNYQLFTKNYALFVYSAPAGLSFSVADPYYTVWSTAGGVTGALGVATNGTASVTSQSTIVGTVQTFSRGAIYNWTASGVTYTHSVSGSIYSAYVAAGGPIAMGFPYTEAILQSSGQYLQTFENGRILSTPGGSVSVLFPIGSISISNTGNLTLNLGGIVTLTANPLDTQGNYASGRALTWSTSNGNVATVQSNGYSATIQAIAAGSANITVTGEGKTSLPIAVTVIGQCCGIGSGAPSLAISQAFQTAATRNNLSVLLPNPTPVVQSGSGYIQTFTAANGSGATYVISESSQSLTAYVISGALYSAYLSNGGFSGSLGYPASDASNGTQTFTSGAALAGSPVLLVPTPIAAKWLTTSLGAPQSTATTFISLAGTHGNMQAFAGGYIFGLASGAAYSSSGLILARYLALSGPTGTLGTPLTDVFTSGATLRQNFETGYIDLQPGASAAVEHYNPLNPSITTQPSTVAPGGRTHVTIAGFALGATLSVSLSGQSPFTTTAPAGQFAWDILVPSTAKAGVVTIQATSGSLSTSATYNIVSAVGALFPTLTPISGDQQTGAPGSTLTAPLLAVLTDSSGNPLPGVAVSYSPSPGASAIVSSVTDANGQIAGSFRLPVGSGIALLSITAAGQTVTFSAISKAKTIANFPVLTSALAAEIAYYQNLGLLGSPNGPATATSITTTNPWLATKFAGLIGGVSIEAPNTSHILDLLNAGSPLVLMLSNGATVNAFGVNADSSLTTNVPIPQGLTITGVIRIDPTIVTPQAFVATVPAGASISSPAGVCTNAISTYIECDGSQSAYLLQTAAIATVLDLTSGTTQTASANPSQITRINGILTITPQTIAISAVVSAASFLPTITSGEIISIFGAGFITPTIIVNGQPAQIIATFPFQINAILPTINGASATLTITGPTGTATQTLTLQAAAPSIFGIVNQDGTINSATNPAPRGSYISIYGTGLGTSKPTVTIGSTTVTPAYAGAAPTFTGLFQINAQIPTATAPGAAVQLTVTQQSQTSNAVPVAIQ